VDQTVNVSVDNVFVLMVGLEHYVISNYVISNVIIMVHVKMHNVYVIQVGQEVIALLKHVLIIVMVMENVLQICHANVMKGTLVQIVKLKLVKIIVMIRVIASMENAIALTATPGQNVYIRHVLMLVI